MILYSSHCPKCKMIKSILENKGIPFTVCDDEDVYMPIAKANNIMSMPFADVDGFILSLPQLQAAINLAKAGEM